MIEKTERFQLRLTPADKAVIRELAEKLQRTQSDAFRIAARSALAAVNNESAQQALHSGFKNAQTN